jgi:hypothetical protein
MITMDEKLRALSYSRPMEADRPPMYTLVMTIMASAFLILLGIGGLIAFIFSLAGKSSQLAVIWVVLGPIFIFGGARSLMQTVHFLRGGFRAGDYQRWMFMLPESERSGLGKSEEFMPRASSRR